MAAGTVDGLGGGGRFGGETRHQLVSGWMEREARARVAAVLQSVKPRISAEAFKSVLLQAPFSSEVGQLSAGDAALAKAYWTTVTLQSPCSGDEATAVQSLMAAGRLWAAFDAIQWGRNTLNRRYWWRCFGRWQMTKGRG